MMMKEENIKIRGKLFSTIYSKNNFNISLFRVHKDTLKIVSNKVDYEYDTIYEFTGVYETTKYGEQFKAKSIRVVIDDPKAIISFLSGDRFPGIGKKTIEKLIDSLGTNLINDIKENPNILDDIEYLNDKKRSILVTGIKGLNQLDDINLWLLDLGLGQNASLKLTSIYGLDTKEIISSNPYIILKELDYIGFKVIDRIALSLGFLENSEIRIKEGIRYILTKGAYSNGDTFMYLDDVIYLTNSLLGLSLNDQDYLYLINENKKEDFILIDNKLFLTYIYVLELKIANKLKNINANKKHKFSLNRVELLISEYEKHNNIELTSGQRDAIKGAFTNNISIITGGPGTGKSTIIQIINHIYKKLKDDYILVCAPTGKAAKRLCSKEISAQTIHSALGYDGIEFEFNRYNLLPYNYIIIDEASMIDISLTNALLEALKDNVSILFVGDVNQLPSVGPGNVLNDMIKSKLINTYYLTEILRQKEGSNIVKLANMVLNNNIDLNKLDRNSDVFFYNIDSNDYLEFIGKLFDSYKDDLQELQILIPKYDGKNGIIETNNYIQETFYSNNDFISVGEKKFYVNDKVIETKNNHELDVMNGDQGFVMSVKKDEVLVDFYKPITIPKQELINLDLAYAISIHKSQGNEFLNVILPLYKSYSFMLTKKLVYTAITRAKSKLIILGDPSLLYRLNIDMRCRNSYLYEHLQTNDIIKEGSKLDEDSNVDPLSELKDRVPDLDLSLDNF